MGQAALLVEVEKEQRSRNEDRRGAIRQASRGRANVQLFSDGPLASWHALIRDVSSLGIAFLLPDELPAGAILDLRLETRRGLPIRPVRGRVVHVQDQSDGN